MEDAASKSGVAKLNLDNYHTWSVEVRCWLVTKGLFKWTQQTPGTTEAAAADRESDAKALAYLGMTLTEQYLPTFSECKIGRAHV